MTFSAAYDPTGIRSEEEVLGAFILKPDYLTVALAELHLASGHFYRDRHREIYEVLVALHDRGKAIDEILVVNELRRRGRLEAAGGEHYISELAAKVAYITTSIDHAEVLIAKAQWRTRRGAGQDIMTAAEAEDMDALVAAEALLAQDVGQGTADFDPDKLADVAFDMLEGQQGVECFPWPFHRLNELSAGGVRRGELVIVAGHTSHGKSVWIDQMLDCVSKHGRKVRLYMNEMSLEQRTARALTRRTGIPYATIVQGRASAEQAKLIARELNRGLPWGITNVTGWTAEEVGHHIRRRRWDVAAVDHLHEFDYEDEKDIRRMISSLARTAKLANCALIVGAQLNERRVTGNTLPRPTISDLKGTSQIKQAADTICFVYREQDSENAEPQPEGNIYLAKGRNNEVGGTRVYFNGDRLRFDLRGDPL